MAVTWTLKAADGSSLAHQPATGSPLALKFTNSGDAHISGYATELIDTALCESTSSPVAIDLTPDNTGYTLDEASTRPSEQPASHDGVLTWTNGSNGLTTLSFTVSGTTNVEWIWWFGQTEPAVALKLKVKIKRV